MSVMGKKKKKKIVSTMYLSQEEQTSEGTAPKGFA